MKLGRLIRMDEIITHQKRLQYDDDGMIKEGKLDMSIMPESKVFQERGLKADYNMNLHIKEQMWKIAYP